MGRRRRRSPPRRRRRSQRQRKWDRRAAEQVASALADAATSTRPPSKRSRPSAATEDALTARLEQVEAEKAKLEAAMADATATTSAASTAAAEAARAEAEAAAEKSAAPAVDAAEAQAAIAELEEEVARRRRNWSVWRATWRRRQEEDEDLQVKAALDERAKWISELKAAREKQKAAGSAEEEFKAKAEASEAKEAAAKGRRPSSTRGDSPRRVAKLIGHQNHKKIQHTMRIKEENDALKRMHDAACDEVTNQRLLVGHHRAARAAAGAAAEDADTPLG